MTVTSGARLYLALFIVLAVQVFSISVMVLRHYVSKLLGYFLLNGLSFVEM